MSSNLCFHCKSSGSGSTREAPSDVESTWLLGPAIVLTRNIRNAHEKDEDGTEEGVDEGDGSVRGWKHCYTVFVMDGRTCRRTRGRKIEQSRVYTWNQKWNYCQTRSDTNYHPHSTTLWATATLLKLG